MIEFHVVVNAEKLGKGINYDKVRSELESKVEESVENTSCRIILDIDF
jgi:hypothetical protein